MLKNNRGFTLIEMLVVMLIISVLLILIIPNLTDQTGNVNDKGCEALEAVVQAQADAYFLDKREHALTIQTLIDAEYIGKNQAKCGNDISLTISNGKVSLPEN